MHKITYALVFIGALNWGLVGLFGFNMVEFLFASLPALERLIYVLVGVSAVIELMNHMSSCKECSSPVMVSKKSSKKKK